MTKKLLLVVGTLVVLVGGLVVYRQYLGADFQPAPTASGEAPPVQLGGRTVGGVAIGTAEGLLIPVADPETGLRQAAFRCAKCDVDQDTGEYVLSDPDIELYLPSGQTVYIDAREGRIVADEAAGKLVPRRGTLVGAVRIRVDLNRQREDEKAPLETRRDDLIVIRTDEVAFDIDLQEMRAPGDVTLDGKDVRIYGSDLTVQWHSAPDEELRSLRLARGKKMEVNPRSDLLRAGPRDDAATPPQRPVATQPAAAASVLSSYTIVLQDNVVVTVGSRSMQNCDRVEVLFSSQRGREWARLNDDEPAPATRPAPTTRPDRVTTGPTAGPDVEDEMVVITWTGPLVMLPFDPAKAERPAPAADEFELNAHGADLKLVEAGDDGAMTARCGSLTYVSETRTTRLLAPGSDREYVELLLANGNRVISESMRIEQGDDELVLYLDGPGTMSLDTAVQGISVAAAGVSPEPVATQPTTTRPVEAAKPQSGQIAWTEGVRLLCTPSPEGQGRFIADRARFRGDVSFAAGDGSSMAADDMTVYFGPSGTSAPALADARVGGDERFSMPDVSRVEASGKVRLEANEDGDTVEAQRLTIEMGVTDAGDLYPLKADATGEVAASFDGSEIRGDSLTVDFEPSTDPTGRRAKPTAMTADGNVVLLDKGADRAVQAKGTHLDCDLVAGRYVMTGEPATMAYGDEWLFGPKVQLVIEEVDGKRHVRGAIVVGAGVAKILLSRDLSGAELPDPVPGLIRWNEQMEYIPADDTLVFSGGVAFDSAAGIDKSVSAPIPFESVGDHLRCGTLVLTLEADDDGHPTSGPAVKTGDIVDTRRKVRSIVATEDVRLLSRRHDEEGYLVNRLQVTGGNLDWDAIGSEISVEGPGTLSLEDYRPTPARTDADDLSGPEQLDRPAITAFQWQDGMHLVQALWQAEMPGQSDTPRVWTATLDGKVMMRHRSGQQIADVGKLPIRLPDPLPAGRIAELDCRHMLARFVAADAAPDAEAASGAANLTLTLFEALGDVVFRDGPYEAQGGRIVYDQDENVAVIYGSEAPDSTDATPAMVSSESPDGKAFDTVSPVITVQRIGNAYRVTALEARGTGYR